MQDLPADDCPLPEPFRTKVGLTLFLGWLFYLGFVTRTLFAPLMPAIEKELGINHSQAGTFFLMISIGYMLAPLCSGLISSRINHRGTLTVSAWTVGLVLIPFGWVESLAIMRLQLMLIGLAAGVHLPSAIATIAAEIRKEDWGKALSVHQAAPPLSFVSAPLIAVMLLRWCSWRQVLLVWASLALLSALAYSLRGRGGDFPGRLPGMPSVRRILGTPSFWIMVLLFSMAMGGNAGIYAMLPLFLTDDHGMALSRANTLVGLSQVSGLLVMGIAGWLTDRIGQKRTMAAALLTAGLATLLIGLLRGQWLLTIIFIQPALLSTFFPAAFAALTRVAPPHLRSVTSALGPPTAFLIGGGLLPLLIGYLGAHYTFSTGIVLAGIFMLVGPLLMLRLRLGQYDDQSGC
jgi:NNP family nitrate/nitrite transporter-like MFS transporter